MIETDGERIDSEVASVEIILERTILDDRLTGTSIVALATSSHELYLLVMKLELSGAEIAEDADVSSFAETLAETLSQADAGPIFASRSFPPSHTRVYHHAIDVLAGAVEKEVAHVPSNHVALEMELIGRLTYLVEDVSREQTRQILICEIPHDFLLWFFLKLVLSEVLLKFSLEELVFDIETFPFLALSMGETVCSPQKFDTVEQDESLPTCMESLRTTNTKRHDRIAGCRIILLREFTTCLIEHALPLSLGIKLAGTGREEKHHESSR